MVYLWNTAPNVVIVEWCCEIVSGTPTENGLSHHLFSVQQKEGAIFRSVLKAWEFTVEAALIGYMRRVGLE